MRYFSVPIPRPVTWAISTVMARLRRIDEAIALKLHHPHRNTLAQPPQGTGVESYSQPFQQMPVPWTFLTSGYFIGFLIFVRSISLVHRLSLTQSLAGSRLE